MTFQATVTGVIDDGATTTLTVKALGLLKWTYPRNSVPVQVRVIDVGALLSIQVLPHLQPSWWITEHIARCKICAAIVKAKGTSALPMPKPIDLPRLDPHGAPVKVSFAGETGARSWWRRFVALWGRYVNR